MQEKKTFFPVSSGLVDKVHVAAMEHAVWLFLWLIDKTTGEEGPATQRSGVVLYGNPVAPGLVNASLGLSERTYLNHLRHLEKNGYVTLVKEAKGYVIRVTNSKKWHWRDKQHAADTSRRGGLGRPYGANRGQGEVDWEAEARTGWVR